MVQDIRGSDVPVVFALKEIPHTEFEPGKVYLFFAHVIKGQEHNMPMLKQMMKLKCNLVEYEKVVDERGRRLIFFGHESPAVKQRHTGHREETERQRDVHR
jgi:alpha-aminoadipic semialdehyde synthase